MHGKLYVWLGTRRALKRGAPPLAAYLDRARHAGLPVPRGLVLFDAAWHYALGQGLVRVVADGLQVADPTGVQRLITAASFSGPVVVRPAFAVDAGSIPTLVEKTGLDEACDARDAGAFARTLTAVWGQALAQDPGGDVIPRDVLVMAAVPANYNGVAWAEENYEDDGLWLGRQPDQLAAEAARLEYETTVPRLYPGEWPTESEGYRRRLQLLLRGIRRTFGPGNWRVVWADDGRICWLLQLQTNPEPVRRNEAFTAASLQDILPNQPSPFMAATVADSAPQLLAFYRRYDSGLPASRPLIEVLAGRPLLNISLVGDVMRRWGLPTKLVTTAIGGQAPVSDGWRPLRLMRHTPTLIRLAAAQLLAVGRARQAARRSLAATSRLELDFRALVDLTTEQVGLLATQMLALNTALSLPLFLLRRTGGWPSQSERVRLPVTTLVDDLRPLRQLLASRPDWRSSLQEGVMPAEAAFQHAWDDLMQRQGHRGPYETDLARPRYHERPDLLWAALLAPPFPARAQAASGPTRRRRPSYLTRPLWWYVRRLIEARERLRHDMMIGFDRLRRALLARADRAVGAGQLPHREALWFLAPDEVRRLDEGAVVEPAQLAEREARYAAWATLSLPGIVWRHDDLTVYRRSGGADASFGARTGVGANGGRLRLQGTGLTQGRAAGRAWVLDQPELALPANYRPEHTILVTRTINPGWTVTCAQVAGVVIEIGDDLSYGSIVLRDLGLPAITNVARVNQLVRNGDWIRLDAERGIVTIDTAPADHYVAGRSVATPDESGAV